jgi:hypothetical protein
MKSKGKFGSDLFFWAIVGAVALYLFGSDITRTLGGHGRTSPQTYADIGADMADIAETCPPPVSVFVADSVMVSGLNVRLINGHLIFVRDSFDPETVRVVGGIFSIVNN